MDLSGTVPTFTGGTIANGQYVLTQVRSYSGSGGAMLLGTDFAGTMVVNGSRMAFALVAQGNMSADFSRAGSYSVITSNSISFLSSCQTGSPAASTNPSSGGFTYSASGLGGTLTIAANVIDGAAAPGIVYVFTLS
jgi:hypothetical protein